MFITIVVGSLLVLSVVMSLVHQRRFDALGIVLSSELEVTVQQPEDAAGSKDHSGTHLAVVAHLTLQADGSAERPYVFDEKDFHPFI